MRDKEDEEKDISRVFKLRMRVCFHMVDLALTASKLNVRDKELLKKLFVRHHIGIL